MVEIDAQLADNVSHQWEAGTATDQPMRERHVPRSRYNDRLRHCAEPITVHYRK